ncbi:MAG TPA: 3-deoxy-D-manno-octulosonic acid transferase, partial [Micavibrio sp.]
DRLNERMGMPGLKRPAGHLIWFHAASVGEAQSTLILVNALLNCCPGLHVLVTTGTVASARLMSNRLPPRAIHQFYPLDHPGWVARFLHHWEPDMIIWMESELWPNMLGAIRARNIPSVLINAHMSRRSYRRWKKIKRAAADLLLTFDLCLAQTPEDAASFHKLGMLDIRVRDNLKYSADPLPCDPNDLNALRNAVGARPLWLYASTHDGEEDLARRIHQNLKQAFPSLLTIIAPRHPSRRDEIVNQLSGSGLSLALRGESKDLPGPGDDIYIADTMGELGLLYSLAPIACIGRSFSNDGGGGHNPIEAVQLGCGVLYGPHVQNQVQLFAEMTAAGAAICAQTPEDLSWTLQKLLSHPDELTALRDRGLAFAASKSDLLKIILKDLDPILADCNIKKEGVECP